LSAYLYQKIKKEDVVSLEESVKAAQVRIDLACMTQYSLASKQHSSILKLAVKPLEAENAALRRRLKVEQWFTLMLANQHSSTGGDDDSVDEPFVVQPRIARSIRWLTAGNHERIADGESMNIALSIILYSVS